MTVSDLTEQELISRIKARLMPPPRWMLVGIGDDAAVVEPVRNQVEVLTVDSVVEGVHFDRRFTPPAAIGHRALAVNLSDLAAMGATPRLALLSLALPSDLPCHDFDAIADGFTALAATHQIHVAGGNLTRSPGPLVLDVTAVGWTKRRRVLTRGGRETRRWRVCHRQRRRRACRSAGASCVRNDGRTSNRAWRDICIRRRA